MKSCLARHKYVGCGHVKVVLGTGKTGIALHFGVFYLNLDFNPLNTEFNPICHLLVLLGDLTFIGPCIVSIFQYTSNKMQRYTVYLYLETALHVLGGTSTHHQKRIYSIWYLSHRCDVVTVRHPQHTQTGSNSSTIAADSSNGVTNTRCCRYSYMRSW
jgi:hypothetical protein